MSREVMYMGRGRPPKCPFCGSFHSVLKGIRVTKTLGNRRIRLCKKCGRKFTPKNQKVVEKPSKPSKVGATAPAEVASVPIQT